MSGGLGSIANTLTGGLLGGGGAKIKVNNQTAQDTAQQETDKSQQKVNAAISRKKNRSLLSTGANSSDDSGVQAAQAAKKLLGE
ncbi:hypothetical protein PT276_08110 [Orbaceae bacterium ESL0721]|nr:hypothetical protein [Orbaceae bacterium ESL0721]